MLHSNISIGPKTHRPALNSPFFPAHTKIEKEPLKRKPSPKEHCNFRPDYIIEKLPTSNQSPRRQNQLELELEIRRMKRLQADSNISDHILVNDRNGESYNSKHIPNNSWNNDLAKNIHATDKSKMMPGVNTDNYFSLITLIREQMQRLVEQFGLPHGDIHRMVTYKQLFEFLIGTLRTTLEGNTAAYPYQFAKTQRRKISPDREMIKRECKLLKQTNRLLMKSEAMAKLKLQQLKNEWRVACEKMKTLHGIFDYTDSQVISVQRKGQPINRHNSMAMIQNPQPYERLRTSKSQTKIANSVVLENETTLRLSHMALQVEHLKAQLQAKSRRIGELQQLVQIKDKEIRCLSNEYQTLTQKLKIVQNHKTEKAILYEHELLQTIRKVSTDQKYIFGRKQVKRSNTFDYDKPVVGVPQASNRNDTSIEKESIISNMKTLQNKQNGTMIPRLTFNTRQDFNPQSTITLKTQAEESTRLLNGIGRLN